METKICLWSRRQALYLIAGAVGSIALHACTPSSSTNPAASGRAENNPSPGALKASFGIVTWIGYTPFYIAQEKGFFQEAGLALDTTVFNSGTEAMAAFGAGRVDGLSVVPSEAITLAANGKEFKVVYIVDTSNGGDGILARNAIADIPSLKGKRIAVETGGVSHFFLLQVLEEHGLTEKDVTLVNLTPDAAAAAYQSGNAEAAVTYAPFLFTANAAQSDGRIIYDSSKLQFPTAIADMLLFDSSFVASNPEAIKAFIRGNARGLEFLQTNRQEGLEIASKNLGLTPAELEEQLKGVHLATLDDNVNMLNNPDSNLYLLKPMASLVTFLKNQGQIEQEPEMEKTLAPEFVLAVQQNR